MEFPNSSDQKRYHSLFHYNKTVYGGRVYKASLNAGCTCPNRDGSRGIGGCTFCQGGSHYFAGTGEIMAQLEAERQRIHRKNPTARLIAYFQAGTNTYGDISQLEQSWNRGAGLQGCGGNQHCHPLRLPGGAGAGGAWTV